MARKEFEIERKHLDYINRVAPELIEAEEKVDRIKKSKEWKRAYEYFNILKHRGHIKSKPTKKNGYKIELWEDVVPLEKLEGIVTAEQMEQIRRLSKTS